MKEAWPHIPAARYLRASKPAAIIHVATGAQAVHALKIRKRLSGVGREASPEMLEKWITEGHM